MIYLLPLLLTIAGVFGSGDIGCLEHTWVQKFCKFPNSGRCDQGSIMAWYGELARVPCGWRLCDGGMHTPDLQGKFLLGANDEYPQHTMGGQYVVHLTVKNLPRHFHAIPQDYIDIHAGGRHKHHGYGHTEGGGDHYHEFDQCEAHPAGAHTHQFTVDHVGGGHTTAHVNTSVHDGAHDHGCTVTVSGAGYHTHSHDFHVGYSDVDHTHADTFSIQAAGAHTHHTYVHFSVDELSHYHDVGTLYVNNHDWSHDHDWYGNLTFDEHYHEIINLHSDAAGVHGHTFSLQTDYEADHTHDVWANTPTPDGGHSHHVPEITISASGAHDHEVLAYFEQDKDTLEENKIFNIAADAVDKSQQCPGARTNADGSHDHTVPAHDTSDDGAHSHSVHGEAHEDGAHSHSVEGTIHDDGYHYHNFNGQTESATHGSDVTGTVEPQHQTLTHDIHGRTGLAGGFGIGLSGNFESTPDGSHGHEISGRVWTADDTNHTHPFGGSISTDGYHDHEAHLNCHGDGSHWHYLNFDVDIPDHPHDITGSISAEPDHTHSCWGKTGYSGVHTHNIDFMTNYVDAHIHSAWGETVEDCAEHIAHVGSPPPHVHPQTGTDPLTVAHCQGHYFSILPPYTAEYWICCVGCDYDHGYWQQAQQEPEP